ncbi:MAG: NAD(P)/FAD-dependent oxidoreductase [Hyphomonadaceae bacterium]
MRIAVIGAGISGLGAAWAMKDLHEVTLFEKEERLGGHANTLTIDYDGEEIAVDTGFIVFNAHNYPNLVALLDHLHVETHASDMSFSVSDPDGFEWSSNGLGGIFAWKRNLTSPGFLCMLGDIVKFGAQARADLRDAKIGAETLEDYVARLRLSRGFLSQYLLPMGAAIWSTPERDMLRYPARSFLSFFNNHRLLETRNRPQWRTVTGGSISYVETIRRQLGHRVRSGDPVVSVTRDGAEVLVRTASGSEARFDQVVMASHTDETLAMLTDATSAERAALSAIRYAPNTAYLHRDESLMPKRKAAWASWNYLRGRGDGSRVCVSYWMNRLQKINDARPLFVTLNPPAPPAPELTFAKLSYDHPQFDNAALQAQGAVEAMQGHNRTWFAGAWLGHGFHEDGLASGFRVAKRLGARLPWSEAQPSARPAPELVPVPA